MLVSSGSVTCIATNHDHQRWACQRPQERIAVQNRKPYIQKYDINRVLGYERTSFQGITALARKHEPIGTLDECSQLGAQSSVVLKDEHPQLHGWSFRNDVYGN